MNFKIEPMTQADREWVLEVFRGWGADFIVSRGEKVYVSELDGFIAWDETGKQVGLVTYEIIGDQCQIATLDAYEKFCGIGTSLIEAVTDRLKGSGVKRLWLITTNDNVDAIRFYHKRGFTIAAIHINAIEQSRKLKPTIPKIGQYGIAIRDEIVFEMLLV